MIKPECSMDEAGLEEAFEDLKRIDSAYRRVKGRRQKFEGTEEELNKFLLEEVLPVAKTLAYFKTIQCEPKEVCIYDLGEGLLGKRSLYTVFLNSRYMDDLMMPSVLVHETAHALSAMSDDSLVTLLGWEIDARLILAGREYHRVALYRALRNMVFHFSYLKAKSVGEIDRWREVAYELYGNEIGREGIEENIRGFEMGEEEDPIFGHRFSDYTILPYLSIKGALKAGIAYVLEEYELFGKNEREEVEISALLRVWNSM